MTQHTPGENFEHDQPCSIPTHAGQTYAECGDTPGPWTVEDFYGMLGRRVTAGGKIVAEIRTTHNHEPERLANARLIAKAPEMYAELKNLMNLYHSDHAPFANIRALLAKIENE